MSFYHWLRRNLSESSIKMWLQRYDRWQHWEIFRSPQIRCIVYRLVSHSGDQIVLMIVNTVGITMGGRQVIYKKPEPGHDIGQIRARRMLALKLSWGENDGGRMTRGLSLTQSPRLPARHHNDTQQLAWIQHNTLSWHEHKSVCVSLKENLWWWYPQTTGYLEFINCEQWLWVLIRVDN